MAINNTTKRKMPAIVKTSILTMITVIFWIVFEVVKILMAKPPPSVSLEILAPIEPTLDQTSLDNLQQRLYLSDEEVGNINIATPTARPTPVATSRPSTESATSVTASESATATNGGILR